MNHTLRVTRPPMGGVHSCRSMPSSKDTRTLIFTIGILIVAATPIEMPRARSR